MLKNDPNGCKTFDDVQQKIIDTIQNDIDAQGILNLYNQWYNTNYTLSDFEEETVQKQQKKNQPKKYCKLRKDMRLDGSLGSCRKPDYAP